MSRSIAQVGLCFLVSFVVMLLLGEWALALLTLLLVFAILKISGK